MNDLTEQPKKKETETVPQKVGTEVSDGVIADTAGGRKILDLDESKEDIVFDITTVKYEYMPAYLLRKYNEKNNIGAEEKKLICKILQEKGKEDNGEI